MTYRDRLIAYVKEEYGADPEYLWVKFPVYFIFRHASNRKWFGLVMNVRRKSLGLDGDSEVDVLNVKLPDMFLAGMQRAFEEGAIDKEEMISKMKEMGFDVVDN